eukprot:Hpha_TRINITY_DN10129_c0_g1::TRINITY_DN10129_c0_g1_i1::g.131453::m.131453/K15356/VRG4, GONST1; GDP-mannose transporter
MSAAPQREHREKDEALSKRDVSTPNCQPSPRLSEKVLSPNPAPLDKDKVDASKRELVWAIGVFGFSAVGMTTGNKLAVEYLRDKESEVALPGTLVLLQMLGTLMLLGVNWSKIDPSLVSWKHAWKWVPIFCLSATGMYTSARAFVYVNVSFVIIMRNLGTFLTTAVEYFVRKQQVSTQTLLAEAAILAGIVLYGHSMVHVKDFWKGIFWCSSNTLVITAWSVLLKHRIDNDPDVKALNKFAMSFYNNLMGVPYFFSAAVLTNEHKYWKPVFSGLTPAGWVVVLITCAIGFMISTSGFALQRLVTATTFNVINNLVKVVNILFGLVFLNDKFPGTLSVAGCIIALLAGGWYSAQATHEKTTGHIEPFDIFKVLPGWALIGGCTSGVIWYFSRGAALPIW